MIGVGNPWRGDDAAGLEVARLVRGRAPAGTDVLEHGGEAASLIDTWRDARIAVIVDATASGAAAGTVRRIDVAAEPMHPLPCGVSTHGVGVAEAIELARTLGRLPERLVVFCIEGEDFAAADSLSPSVEGAVERVADAVMLELAAGG